MPDTPVMMKYGNLSVGAVLAYKYFGHRPYREEYLSDMRKGMIIIPPRYGRMNVEQVLTPQKQLIISPIEIKATL